MEWYWTQHVTLMEPDSGSLGLLDLKRRPPVEALKPFLWLVLVIITYLIKVTPLSIGAVLLIQIQLMLC